MRQKPGKRLLSFLEKTSHISKTKSKLVSTNLLFVLVTIRGTFVLVAGDKKDAAKFSVFGRNEECEGENHQGFPPHLSAADNPPAGGANKNNQPYDWLFLLVGVGRLELPASWSRTKRATKLRYTPKMKISSNRWIFSHMVARKGFEPLQTESESVVLPLHNRASRL